jgi:hypothetical protein
LRERCNYRIWCIFRRSGNVLIELTDKEEDEHTHKKKKKKKKKKKIIKKKKNKKLVSRRVQTVTVTIISY